LSQQQFSTDAHKIVTTHCNICLITTHVKFYLSSAKVVQFFGLPGYYNFIKALQYIFVIKKRSGN